ncbi:MAG: radical SAM protein [Oscillospiraceae bacterium]|nr:radical SAM protein [Oscillospiraceae bacterium]
MLRYENCTLCPRQCGIDRTRGETGFCQMPGRLTAARAMLHVGEEPCLWSGKGTGAVFFSGCSLRCSYCQNAQISLGCKGLEIDSQRLREIFLELIQEGATSIDLVTPSHFLPEILPALQPKLPVPMIYNCGGYERVETLRELEGLVDIYLPDFKYSDNNLAYRLSAARNYREITSKALQEMYRQVGSPVYAPNGQMLRGMLIRHLVLPGYVDNSLGVLDEIERLFPKKDVPISLMSQYVPMGRPEPPLDRRVTEDEYAAVLSWMDFCGLQEGFLQEAGAATTELLPQFDFRGIL